MKILQQLLSRSLRGEPQNDQDRQNRAYRTVVETSRTPSKKKRETARTRKALIGSAGRMSSSLGFPPFCVNVDVCALTTPDL